MVFKKGGIAAGFLALILLTGCFDESEKMCYGASKLVEQLTSKIIAAQLLEGDKTLNAGALLLSLAFASEEKEAKLKSILGWVRGNVKWKKLLKHKKIEEDVYYCSALVEFFNPESGKKKEYIVEYGVTDKGGGYIEAQLINVQEVEPTQ